MSLYSVLYRKQQHSICNNIVSYLGAVGGSFRRGFSLVLGCLGGVRFLSPLVIVAGSVPGGVVPGSLGLLRGAPWPVVVGVLRACGLCRL